MKITKAFLFAFLVSVLFVLQVSGKKDGSKVKMQKVYMMGISVSFVDSVAFMTDVQELDSANLQSNGFLSERLLYTFQLDNYVTGTCHVPNVTSAVYFSTKRKKMEAKFEKLNRLYQHSDRFALIYLGANDFRFHPEEHIESVELEEKEGAQEGSAGTAKTGKRRKRSASGQPDGASVVPPVSTNK